MANKSTSAAPDKNKTLKCILFITLSALVSSCMGMSKDSDATVAVASSSDAQQAGESGEAAFQSSFYAFARTNCASCHGVSQAPTFAVPSVSAAYAAANNPAYVNYANPSESLFVTRANDGHCGISNCTGNGPSALDQIDVWAAAELATAGSGSGGSSGGTTSTAALPAYLTTTLPIPTPLPSTTFAVMRWPLSQVTPVNAQFAGTKAVLEIQIQLISPTSYIVQDPRIEGLTSPVDIQGIHVMINPVSAAGVGTEEPNCDYWGKDNVEVQPFTLPGTLTSTPFTSNPLDTNAMPLPVLSSADKITIGFDSISAGVIVTALTPNFSSIFANIITPQCLSCHNANNAQGGVNLATFTSVSKEVTAGNPAASAFYTSVTTANPLMPEGGTALTAAQTEAIATWITDGAQNN